MGHNIKAVSVDNTDKKDDNKDDTNWRIWSHMNIMKSTQEQGNINIEVSFSNIIFDNKQQKLFFFAYRIFYKKMKRQMKLMLLQKMFMKKFGVINHSKTNCKQSELYVF